ncbi:hypothetical protein BuS5_01995 [Desulfosarcina sp. BuS5]|uniref:DUF2442 domain-containing protein n=1 Tax=Desulfosarcina sp. BuS5 TaxID=933262 RepID=UPI000489CF0D|nr:DUF2442 domain-containing protein [Desulfosarcina sp. BuS5]WDN89027.1 hypothetical protein BuS5_01995 [Desulfosarcina sp. BuS5]
MKNYPRIKRVEPLSGKRLFVTFANNTKKIYDCSLLLKEETFRPLLNDALFSSVKTDKHGYGVIWSDEIDLSESELWINGLPAEQNSENIYLS